ncbi:hypothetical protein [Geodermatophilus sp. SYSU D00815]
MSAVLLPIGVVALLVLFWLELPLLDRYVFRGRRKVFRGRREVFRGRRERDARERRPRRYRVRGNRVQRPPETSRRPLQVIAADLRRLSRQLALVPAGAPLVRWRALWSAYDAVLTEAAEALEVPHALPDTPVGMARDIERLRVLAALEGAGLVVRG